MTRKRARTSLEIHQNQEPQMVSGYERSREERIKENLERMQKLGIANLSIQLKSFKSNSRTTKRTHFPASPLPPLAPSRRSSRLQNSTPVTYCEVEVSKKHKSLEFGDKLLRLEGGSRPEVYTEEHEKLLGSTEQSWALFVDGIGKDGKRIYDSVTGKTCHQCRQKTLGHRTHCSQCSMVQGQFCGDCLYMRYGEHVLEAKQNLNWICPPCRGICNCSLCRQAKGWPPTGSLYRKISALGYKSVAHYLIQTRKEKAESDDKKTKAPVSAKRSLPFAEAEAESTDRETLESNYNPQELEMGLKPEIAFEDVGEKAHDSVDPLSNSTIEMGLKPEIAFEAPEEVRGSPVPEEVIGPINSSVEKEPHNCDAMKTSGETVVTPVLDEDKLHKPEASEEKNVHSDKPVADANVGRLGLSTNNNNEHEEEEVNHIIVDMTEPPHGVSSLVANTNLEPNSVNDDLKDVADVKEVKMEKTPISKKKHGRATEQVVDSIAGRLRQRRCRLN